MKLLGKIKKRTQQIKNEEQKNPFRTIANSVFNNLRKQITHEIYPGANNI